MLPLIGRIGIPALLSLLFLVVAARLAHCGGFQVRRAP
jgi:hypothetical protein